MIGESVARQYWMVGRLLVSKRNRAKVEQIIKCWKLARKTSVRTSGGGLRQALGDNGDLPEEADHRNCDQII